MDSAEAREEGPAFTAPVTLPEALEDLARSQLEHAADGVRRGLKVYESLQNLNDVIGAEYGDRVIYELLQNAHDAHGQADRDGEIAIHLVIRSETEGELRVANKGRGFSFEDLDAIRNIGISNKEIGESIGNKGLGFRSVEALTDDVHVYSQAAAMSAPQFGGYCFRFATLPEIRDRLREIDAPAGARDRVAATIPRYLVAVAPASQPTEVQAYAKLGYATVICLPLRTAEAVTLARKQVMALDRPDAPLMLFLRRLRGIEIKIDEAASAPGLNRILRRKSEDLGTIPGLGTCQLEAVDLECSGRFFVVRRALDKAETLAAVARSIPHAQQLARWMDWRGDPEISVAVAETAGPVRAPKFYNFLAMEAAAAAPFAGFADAPFFADIDRRNLKADLPLNDYLITQIAETCVGTALAAVGGDVALTPAAVVDLVAWDVAACGKVSQAFVKRRSELRTAVLWPTHDGAQAHWTSLTSAVHWPEGKHRILSPARAAQVGALVLGPLGEVRLDRLHKLAANFNLSLKPSGPQLALWSTSMANLLLAAPRTKPADWITYYSELVSVFAQFGVPLTCLKGQKILLGGDQVLREAFAVTTGGLPPVYYRPIGRPIRRAKGGKGATAPLPPSAISRKLRYLSETVELSDAVSTALRSAGLLRLYDPVEVLANLDSGLGANATEIQKREALAWAFRVWSAGASGIDEALLAANLRVPTVGGWALASACSFSTGWTPAGELLETYLTEAAKVSPDCERARNLMLIGWADWPQATSDQTQTNWRRFLDRLGVRDGIRPIAAKLTRSGTAHHHWKTVFAKGVPEEGLDARWVARAKDTRLIFPETVYQMDGEAWRIPGQTEHAQLTEDAKVRLSDLITAYLRLAGDRAFIFSLGAYHKTREQDPTAIPTPLQVFLQTGDWMAVHHGEEVFFRAPHACWASKTGRQPPRLLDRFSAETAGAVPPILFDCRVGLRDWSDPTLAAARLAALARTTPTLASGDRRDFRDHYRRAWAEVTEGALALLPGSIIVERAGGLQVLDGDRAEPVTVYVTKELNGFASRTLNDHNEPVLDIGEANLDVALRLLTQTELYDPRPAEHGGVRLLVDEQDFTSSTRDPLLVATPGLEWLPDAVILAYQNLGDPLEVRNVSPIAIERRIRGVRVHRCGTLSLSINGKEIVATGADRIQPYQHPDQPTLLVASEEVLDWPFLLAAAPALGKLLGSGVKSLEFLLMRLDRSASGDSLGQPSFERLAAALDRSVDVVREHFAAVDSSVERRVTALLPIIQYFGGEDLVALLRSATETFGPRLDLAAWLTTNVPDLAAADILRVTSETEDMAQVQQRLGLNFGRFNRALLTLGLSGLNNLKDLERLYEVYRNELRPELIDRVRRRYLADFQAARPLTNYLAHRALDFAPFNTGWLDEISILDRDRVRTWVNARAESTLGPEVVVAISPLAAVLDANRRMLSKALGTLAPLIGAWKERHPEAWHGLWAEGDMSALARTIEQRGILDFEVQGEHALPQMLDNLGLWPRSMPVTTDLVALQLTAEDIRQERDRAAIARRDAERAKRSIIFNGAPIDPTGDDFADRLLAAAVKGLRDNPDWFARSRPQRLVLQAARDPKGSRGGGSGGKGGESTQLPEPIRRAMGLASELLVREYLRQLYPKVMTDACWVSKNRRAYHPEADGDDALGYDFRIVTARREWLFEVKSAMDAGGEFELTANELQVAGSAALERKRRYRILYVPYVFDPTRWCVQTLGNPAAESNRNRFRVIRTGSVRYGFDRPSFTV